MFVDSKVSAYNVVLTKHHYKNTQLKGTQIVALR
jgi:hypothetical protein